MNDSHDPLLELILEEQKSVTPSDDAKAKTKAAIEASVAAGVTPPFDLPPSATPSVLAASKWGWWLVPLATLLVVGGTVLVNAEQREAPVATVVEKNEAVAHQIVDRPRQPPPAAVEEQIPRAAKRSVAPERRRSPVRSPAEASPARGTLTEELALVRRAQVAFASGDHREALAAIAVHGERFPRGVLTQEREALRALVLCDSNRFEEAESVVRAFLKTYPTSPQRERIRAACRAK